MIDFIPFDFLPADLEESIFDSLEVLEERRLLHKMDLLQEISDRIDLLQMKIEDGIK